MAGLGLPTRLHCLLLPLIVTATAGPAPTRRCCWRQRRRSRTAARGLASWTYATATGPPRPPAPEPLRVVRRDVQRARRRRCHRSRPLRPQPLRLRPGSALPPGSPRAAPTFAFGEARRGISRRRLATSGRSLYPGCGGRQAGGTESAERKARGKPGTIL
jgi:hypothetical protein